MDSATIGLLGFGVVIILIFLGIPVAFSLLLVSIGGLTYFIGFTATAELVMNNTWGNAANYTLSALPLFLVMGYFIYYSGLISKAFDTAAIWLGHLPGGLAVVSTVAAGMIGATMGSGASATAAMSRLAIPEMLRRGYDKGLAAGAVAAVSTVAVLIPPSMLMVVYASFTGASLGKMLLAGYIPGAISIAVYCVMILIRARLNPKLGPPISNEGITWKRRFSSLKDVWGILLIVSILLGGLYSGVFTATEVAALAAGAALVLLYLSKNLSWRVVQDSVFETMRVSAMIFMIYIGAVSFSSFIFLSAVPELLSSAVTAANLSGPMLVLGFIVLGAVLGAFLDGMSIMLLTLPILLPIFDTIGISLIWFGIIFIKVSEVGVITPPFGIGVFIVKGVVGDEISMRDMFRGIWWFVAMDFVVIALFMLFPQIILWLPNVMRGP